MDKKISGLIKELSLVSIFRVTMACASIPAIASYMGCGSSGGGSSSSSGNSTKPDPDPIVYQCNDLADNDGDTLTDMDDPGCISATDDDETDPFPPIPDFNEKQDFYDIGFFTGEVADIGSAFGDTSINDLFEFQLTAQDFKDLYLNNPIVGSAIDAILGDYISQKYGADPKAFFDGSIAGLVDNPDGEAHLFRDGFSVYGGLDQEGKGLIVFDSDDEYSVPFVGYLHEGDQFSDGNGNVQDVDLLFYALDGLCSDNAPVVDDLEDYVITQGYNYQRQTAFSAMGPDFMMHDVVADIYLPDLFIAVWYLDGTEDPATMEEYKSFCDFMGMKTEFLRRTTQDTAVDHLIDYIETNK